MNELKDYKRDVEERITFAEKNAEEAIKRFFEVKAEKQDLERKLNRWEKTKTVELQVARKEAQREVFWELYELTRDALDETIILTKEDVKRLARKRGIHELKGGKNDRTQND